MSRGEEKILRKSIVLSLFTLALGLIENHASAVPQLFLQQTAGQQADVTWGRLENDRFIIYYDSTQPALAEHALTAVERAYPDFSLLLGTSLEGQTTPPELSLQDIIVSRFKKIPVIVSSRTDGPSFANFIPQTLEIQSTLRPPAALFQHELAHRMMYEHIDLKVGPAGRTFMLAMLPTWWTEGLPEFLTESLGRLETEGYIRAMVLNDSFLSWDRMHALYKASGNNALLGYATSGRFFKYFLNRTPEKNLRDLHEGLKTHQLIPPFFSGAYLLLKRLTGEWPGDLYESFKKDVSKEVLGDLEGMPRLSQISGARKIFSQFGGGSFLLQDNSILTPEFSTPSRAGGIAVYDFKDSSFSDLKNSSLRPLELKTQDRIFAHRKELSDGGFWSTTRVKSPNRTSGHLVSHYRFQGKLNEIEDGKIKERIDFPLNSEGPTPLVRDIVAIAPSTAAVLTTNDTATSLYIMNAELKQHTFVGQWIAPDAVRLVRPHDANQQTESALCAFTIVDHDSERTSLQRLCHGESTKNIIPEGNLIIRDALMTAPDEFLLLVGWHNAQALVVWSKGRLEFISGLPDWVESIAPGNDAEDILLNVFTGHNQELWSVSLKEMRNSHLNWILKLPEKSKWWTNPEYQPYTPPFAKYANDIRKNSPKKTSLLASTSPVTQTSSEKNAVEINSSEKAVTTVPAPYRFKHWMTYPNYTPSFLAGVTTVGLFSRPIVDEMERFYVQLFGSYIFDDSLQMSDRWGLEANLIGNRLFDGWKANLFLRPRFNGVAYSYRCRLPNNPTIYTCPENRPSSRTQFYSFAYLRELGADFRLTRNLPETEVQTDLHGKIFKISPSSSNSFVADSSLRAQDSILTSVGASMEKSLWNNVFFTAPVADLSKREIPAGGSLRIAIDTTHSLIEAKSGVGTAVPKVGYQNYSIELAHNIAFQGHSLGLRNTYSSTGGGSPLNLQEYFRPFKTYLIGANDGLQDISTSLSGNGLLGYNLVGRAQYRNSLNYTFPIVRSLDTRLGLAYLERLEGEMVLSRGGVSDNYQLSTTNSITTITGSMRLNIDVKGYGFYPAILYGKAIDKPLWQLFTQIRFDQFW